MNLLLALALFLGSADGRPHRLPPVDQCAADGELAAFRSQLIDAVERRDSARLLELTYGDIEFDFDGGIGRDRFAAAWQLDRGRDSRLWEELGDALRLGCAHGDDGAYWSPSLATATEIEDPFATYLVIRAGATMHRASDSTSEVVARLDWDLVEAVGSGESSPWMAIRLADGREGFVRSTDLRSPVDYRAAFERIDGRWLMTVFIAGD